MISQQSLHTFAEKLTLFHNPTTTNYMAKFGLENNSTIAEAKTDYAVPTPTCPRCSKSMVERSAKKGKTMGAKFWGCTDYPDCKGSLNFDDVIPSCPECDGPMVKRVSKTGKNPGSEFWGCKKYPKCNGTVSI